MYLDSRERRIHPLPMAPVLVLTILLSPFGLVSYLVLRTVAGRAPAPATDPASRVAATPAR